MAEGGEAFRDRPGHRGRRPHLVSARGYQQNRSSNSLHRYDSPRLFRMWPKVAHVWKGGLVQQPGRTARRPTADDEVRRHDRDYALDQVVKEDGTEEGRFTTSRQADGHHRNIP